MKGRFLSEKLIEQFGKHLVLEEKSEHTVEKYLRDVRAFAAYAEQAEIGKETVIRYKQHLLESEYAVRSINSMLASLNSLFTWLDWHDCRVKAPKTQKQIFCPEEKELTKGEYLRLVNTAMQIGNERLSLIPQTNYGNTIKKGGVYLFYCPGNWQKVFDSLIPQRVLKLERLKHPIF